MNSFAQATGVGPVLDTHVHFWDVSRNIPWPKPSFERLYRDIRPADYKALARPLGIKGSGIVEASDRYDDQLWILDQVAGDDFFMFYVAMLELGAPDFLQKLERLTADERVVGIRGFLWAPRLGLDAGQIAHCRELAKRGMTMDIVSRGDFNPKSKLVALAGSVPELRIIVDHLAGAKGRQPSPSWVEDIRALADSPNVYMKFSSFFDMFNPGSDESVPWESPVELSAYQPHFDVLFEAFGPRRMIWGSNWPVVEMGGSFKRQLELAEQYLKPLGCEVRDQVMWSNAINFYTRRV